jgi:hypothetical protein
MDDDHGWRVVLSFPEHFSEEERKSARQDFAELDPFVHELVYGDSSKAIYCPYGPSIGWRRQRATANREAWFALSVKSFSSFDRSDDGVGDQEHYVVAAVRGSELLALMDAKGVWPATNPPEVGWFGVSRYVAQRIRGNLATQADTMVSGLPGWALPAIAEYPFVRAPFSIYELSSLDVTPLLKPLTMPTVGEAVRIE